MVKREEGGEKREGGAVTLQQYTSCNTAPNSSFCARWGGGVHPYFLFPFPPLSAPNPPSHSQTGEYLKHSHGEVSTNE